MSQVQDENFDEILDKIEVCKNKKEWYWQILAAEGLRAYGSILAKSF